MPTARLLEIADALDRAGYHALEVTGGGCFRAAVARGVESPWERIRAIKLRAHAHAARDGAARHVPGLLAAGRARSRAPLHPLRRRVGHRHLPPARPAQRRRRPRRPRPRAVREAGARLYAGLVYADAPGGDDFLVERAPAAGRARRRPRAAARPGGRARRRRRRRPRRRGCARRRACPSASTCRAPAAPRWPWRSRPRAAGADPIAAAAYPVAVPTHRASSELLPGPRRHRPRLRRRPGRGLGGGAARRPGARRRRGAAAAALRPRLAARRGQPRARRPRGERRAAPGRARRVRPPARGAGRGRPRARRARTPAARAAGRADPHAPGHRPRPLRPPLGGRRPRAVRASPSASGGRRRAPFDPGVRALAEAQTPRDIEPADFEEAREEAGELATSEEELCLVALFGDGRRCRCSSACATASGTRRSPRGASPPRRRASAGCGAARGVRPLGADDRGGRHAHHAAQGGASASCRCPPPRSPPAAAPPRRPGPDIAPTHLVVVESPMVGTFYLRPDARRPAVRLRRRPGRGRPDALHPRGDEALQRAEVRAWPASSAAILVENAAPWSTASRSSSSSPSCRDPARAWSRTAARSRCASSAPAASSASSPWPSTRPPTATRSPCDWPTARSASARRRRTRATCAIERVIAAAKTTGCDAIHPGYGFLSENPDFVRACADNDLVFVGPAPETDGGHGRQGPRQGRDARRRAAARARLDRPAGLRAGGARASPSEAGYPVLLKAAAGGGGRGMRLVERPDELPRRLPRGLARGRGGVRRRRDVPGEGGHRRRTTSRCRCCATATAAC